MSYLLWNPKAHYYVPKTGHWTSPEPSESNPQPHLPFPILSSVPRFHFAECFPTVTRMCRYTGVPGGECARLRENVP